MANNFREDFVKGFVGFFQMIGTWFSTIINGLRRKN